MSLEIPFQTAKQLASAVRKKKIGCLELLDLYLKRVEAYNPELNAIIATDIEGARKRAKAADKAMEISGIRLLEKSGGKSGDFRREE